MSRCSEAMYGMSSREALALARRLGCEERRKGGDVILYHPGAQRSARVPDPTRRKDASRAFVAFLLDVLAATAEARAARAAGSPIQHAPKEASL